MVSNSNSLIVSMQYVAHALEQHGHFLTTDEKLELSGAFLTEYYETGDVKLFKKRITCFLKKIDCRSVELRGKVLKALKLWCDVSKDRDERNKK